MKKPIIISLVVIFIIALGGYVYFSRPQKPLYEFVIVKHQDIIQEVSVTGRVKPAEELKLGFEKSGKVARVYAKVGDKVNANQLLVSLNNTELLVQVEQARAQLESAQSQLEQYKAARDTQEAKLDELKRGTRPEEIKIAETKVANAQKALTDAQNNLENIKNKAEVDLANLYDDVKDILADAYVKGDDAVNKQTDEMFLNDSSSNPQLTFIVTDTQAEIDSKWQRVDAGNALKDFKTELDNLSSDYAKLDEALIKAENHLIVIKNFLTRLADALNASAGLSQTTLATYKSSVNTARTNINTTLANIATQKQALAAQKITNQNNISSAQTSVNEAQNVLLSAQDELTLKKAGATAEQIAAQEAQVRQAEANIVSQEAQIKQAEANVKNYEAQLAKTMLYSPIDGIVTKQEAKIGEIVSSSVSIISLISQTQFQIEANVPEADIAKVKIADSAEITLDAYGSDVFFQAKVIAIEPAETIIEGVATYKVSLQFIDQDKRIKSGMTANIDIITAKRENVIAVPQRAVIEKNGDKIIRILKDEVIQEQKVKTGLRGSDGNIEILEGVNEGDKVIISIQDE